jgi:hypothetical protein
MLQLYSKDYEPVNKNVNLVGSLFVGPRLLGTESNPARNLLNTEREKIYG